MWRGTRCIAGRDLRTRGRINPACLIGNPVPATIYATTTFCGGNGAESIAQARVIAHLANSSLGVDPNVQWEVKMYDGAADSNRRADVVYYDRSDPSKPVQVYEIKQTSDSSYANREAQLANYVNILNGVVNGGATRGTALTGWVDVFLVDTGIRCESELGPTNFFTVYMSWQSSPGLVDVYSYQPPCFDPLRKPVPLPVDVPVTVPVPDPIPDVPFQNPQPYPGYYPNPGTNPYPFPTPTPTPPDWTTNPPLPTPPPRNPGDTGWNWGCIVNPACWVDHLPPLDWQPPWSGGTYGDPHIVTLDGLRYDLHAVGEFDLVNADEYGMRLQARFEPVSSAITTLSATRTIALTLENHVFEIPIRVPSDGLRIDGQPYSLAPGSRLDFGDGAAFIRGSGGDYYVSWPGQGLRPALWAGINQFHVYVPPGTHTSGLLGDGDGNPQNDLVTGYGTQLPADTSPATLHGTFAESWRIAQEESLFTYADGQSTETFTDRSFPSSIVTINDLDPSALADATAHCADAGVVDGAQFDDCVIDWATTHDNAFVTAAATQLAPMLEGGSRTVDASGSVGENFDSSVAPNFSAARYGNGAGTGTFSGPFGHNDRYVFYVPQLPAHDSATIQFDLIAIGDWTTNASSNTVTVDVGGPTVWSGAVATGTPSATGTLASGQPYAVYPVTATVPHTGDQLSVGVSAPIAIGSNRAFAVDNVHASLNLIAPQTFNVNLPLSVSNGNPAGAGNLESAASEDAYRFSTSGGTLQLDLANCGSSLSYYVEWQLVNDDTQAVVGSSAGCAGNTIPNVLAGNYRLRITHTGATGTYDLALYVAPSPQTFNIAVPLSASDGSPVAGAGNLETTSSQDEYAFTTTVDGGLQIDPSNCGNSLGYYIDWKLIDTAGATLYSTSGCQSTLVPSISAGQYKVVVSRNGKTGTYNLGISVQAAPEYFDVSLPVAIDNGTPQTGAGNLETSSSQDNYAFVTTAAGGVQIDFSNCAGSLSYYVDWSLVNDETGVPVYSTSGCQSKLVPNVAAGHYRLSVSRNGHTGTYHAGILVQPAAQVFDVTPPVSVSNGSPSAGAGNLETTASEDDYRFTTTSANDVQVDFSNCAGSLGYYVDWKLVNDDTGNAVYSTSGCGSTRVTGVAAGHYHVAVTRNGFAGTYNVAIGLVPAPDVFNVTLPLSASNGVPAPGAGNLETTSSEDDYVFSTTSAGSVQVDLSGCGGSLGYYVDWKLVDAQSGSTLFSTSACTSKLVMSVPAGQYKLVVSRSGKTGTYNLGLLVQPPAQAFDVSLPVAVSNGSPAAGAGNLETTASEDDYLFTTSADGAIEVDLGGCGGSLGYYVDWKLVNRQSGATLYSTSACASKLVTNVPAGQYEVVVTRNGASGTYNLGLVVQPPAQVFDVSLPATISNGSPSTGAGNLETTASEDDYRFTTAASGALTVAFSNCSSGLGYYVDWKVVNEQSGATVSSSSGCYNSTISALAAGQYRLVVSRNGGGGTYGVNLSLS